MQSDLWNPELKQWLRERSSALGFDLSGIAPVHGLDDAREALDAARFQAWIDAGRAGEMDYLKRRDDAGQLLRSSVRVSQPWANSVVVCAMNYNTPGPRSIDPTDPADPPTGWIARYAWTGTPAHPGEPGAPLQPADYHDLLLNRLQQLAQELREKAGGEFKCYVDTGPMVERSLAARAGIGWIGKNTCVLHQTEGSWLLLGVIVTSLRLAPGAAAITAPDLCGSCTRCIDACPTQALVAPREMDASRCIAYLTIEKKGAIPEELRAPMGRQVFGCDICQDVCPWNRRAPSGSSPIQARPELRSPSLSWLAAMDAPAFRRWFRGSPLERTRRPRLLRNVAIAMGNSRDPRFLPQLHAWLAGDDPVLADTASWAVERIRASESPDQT